MADANLPITGFEKGTVIKDSDAFSLSPIEFSDVRNVRFDNRSVSKISGEASIRTLSNTTPVTLTYWKQPNNIRYVYQTADGNTYLNNATGTDSRITKGASSTAIPLAANAQYTGGLFNGGATYIVNDGTNIPQYINAIGSGTATQELVDIPAWAYDASIFPTVRAKVLRPFRNVLVAGNLTYTDTSSAITFAPGTIRVSNVAERGVLPTWDPNLAAANTAEEIDLSTNDEIIDMIPLKEELIVFCRNSIHSVRLTGNASFPVATTQLLTGRGLLSANCAIEFYGRIFAVGNDDIYLYGGGSSVNSISDSIVRDYFFDNLNEAQKDITFVTENRKQDEIWLCYPKGSSTTCNEALIYNYTTGSWTIRDLPNIRDAAFGATISNDDYTEGELSLLLLDNTTQKLKQVDIGTSFDGEAINAYIERKGFDIDPNDDLKAYDIAHATFILRGVGNVDIRMRATEAPGRPANLDSNSDRYLEKRTFSLDPDMGDYKINPRSEGRFLNLRIGTNDTTSSWSLIRYNLGVRVTDNR